MSSNVTKISENLLENVAQDFPNSLLSTLANSSSLKAFHALEVICPFIKASLRLASGRGSDRGRRKTWKIKGVRRHTRKRGN